MDDRPHPPKSHTIESTWTDESNESDPVTGVGPPGLWAMINAATRYERDQLLDDSSDDTDSTDGLRSDDKSRDAELTSDPLSTTNATIARLAQLSVTNYNHPGGSILREAAQVPEPPSLSDGPNPDIILRLIQKEFGHIARDTEEEVFIAQKDAGIVLDAMILGVIHLTSHRVTFHASLLSTRPDLAPNSQIIRSGPIVIHRRGLHWKRRRWLELSHDMMSLYKNATDEARARPLKSLLLSDITKVYEMDPARPTIVNLGVTKGKRPEVLRLEFDATESAILWRREIQEAIFLNRQRQYELLTNSNSPDGPNGRQEKTGVRICIPLHRIEAVNMESFLDFAHLVSLTITKDDVTHSHERGLQAYPQRAFKLVCLTKQSGVEINSFVAAAKVQHALRPEVPFPSTADVVTVDFGPLAFAEHGESNGFFSPKSPETYASTKQRRAQDMERRMKKRFALREDLDVFVNRTWLQGCIHSSGYLVISNEYICFWSKSYTYSDITYRFATRDLNQAKSEASTFWGHHSFSVEIKGHPTLYFATQGVYVRDSLVRRLNSARDQSLSAGFTPTLPSLGTPPELNDDQVSTSDPSLAASDGGTLSTLIEPGISPMLSDTEDSSAALAMAYLAPLDHTINFVRQIEIPLEALTVLPRPINIPHSVLGGMRSRHFICLSIGSRGDVQPYIALCLGLIAEGHTATIVTHEEYKEWVEGFGVRHRTAGGDPTALMRLSVEHSMFSPQFFKESLGKFRGWLDELLLQAWRQCQDADVLIESPSAMAGVHIAEALKIPYIRAFTMPWTRTTAYPHAFLSPPVELSGTVNYSTYVLFDNIFWTAMSGQVNRWRKKHLHLPRTDIDTLAQTKIPFIYNFSPAVVPKPLDWGDIISVSGYWFLDNPDLNWKAPQGLLDFIATAKADRVPLVYIGFGSIVVPHPRAMTRSIIKGVMKAGVRAIISKGWSDRLESEKEKEKGEVLMPPECYALDKVPHDWLFPQLDAAMHHGGAGTTGASLRAGIPTLIKPWFGDQFFWASRVHKLGAGMRVDNLSSSDLSAALKKATSDRIMKEKAVAVGKRIRAEDGVNNAIRAIYTYMDRAANRSAA